MEGIFRNYVAFHIMFFFIFFVFFVFSPHELLAQSPATGSVCDKVNCGQGKCVANGANGALLQSFDCICNDGWKKMQIGPLTFPACTIPNCTINYQCGNGASPAPPPPPPPPPPPTNSLININPCVIAWCGEGSCVADGLGYECKCNDGSSNLLNLTGAACFKECSLGSDCNGVALGSPSSSNISSSSSGNYYTSFPPSPPPGSNEVANCSSRFGRFAVLSLCFIFVLVSNLTWG